MKTKISNLHKEQQSSGIIVSNQIRAEISKALRALRQFGYDTHVSSIELYAYMTGEIFSEDTTTLRDVLGKRILNGSRTSRDIPTEA